MKTANGIRLIIENFYCNFLCFSLFESLSFLFSRSLPLSNWLLLCFRFSFICLRLIHSSLSYVSPKLLISPLPFTANFLVKKFSNFKLPFIWKRANSEQVYFNLIQLNVLIKFLISKIDDDTYTPTTSLIILTNTELRSRS